MFDFTCLRLKLISHHIDGLCPDYDTQELGIKRSGNFAFSQWEFCFPLFYTFFIIGRTTTTTTCIIVQHYERWGGMALVLFGLPIHCLEFWVGRSFVNTAFLHVRKRGKLREGKLGSMCVDRHTVVFCMVLWGRKDAPNFATFFFFFFGRWRNKNQNPGEEYKDLEVSRRKCYALLFWGSRRHVLLIPLFVKFSEWLVFLISLAVVVGATPYFFFSCGRTESLFSSLAHKT